MFNVADTINGYKFHPDNASISRGFQYSSVSYTALYPWRQGLTNGHSSSSLRLCACLPGRQSLAAKCACLFRSSWRKLRTMERTKLLSLVGLVFQSSLLAITTRYSRVDKPEGHRYLSTTAVLTAEMVKVLVCLVLVAVTSRNRSFLSQLSSALHHRDLLKSCLPALLYTVQNNLQFVAVTYIDAATFQVTYQLKILTTALFSVLVLRKRLDGIHWSALVLLTFGVVMVQFPQANDCASGSTAQTCQTDGNTGDRVHAAIVGVVSVLIMCVSSGFAGVYTEKILKAANSSQTMWTRNLQLALSSCLIGSFVVYIQDGSAVTSHGFFYQYDKLTWCIVLQLAALGLLISLVMKHADNLIKGFASSIAIIVTTVISGLVLEDLQVSCSFLLGTVVVLASVLLYNVDRTGEFSKPEESVI
ncbi:UDP-N-acetylglucosamine transporter [Aplysia californica]|uniref:UDP-N-acetylglucosamine transporter n=1 Tax=Aplysia californica TaxID=6500 RepID=A0ABM0ZVP8_APLCA|nr:UDP-N-acetylglucosamine transporter [Aplysia californica]